MEISKRELEQIIKEEIDTVLDEGALDRLVARGKGAATRAGSQIKGMAQSGVGKLAGAVGSPESAAALATQAASTKAAGASAATAAKGLHVAKTSYKEFENDMSKLGLSGDPDIKQALSRMRTAIKKLEARKGSPPKALAAPPPAASRAAAPSPAAAATTPGYKRATPAGLVPGKDPRPEYTAAKKAAAKPRSAPKKARAPAPAPPDDIDLGDPINEPGEDLVATQKVARARAPKAPAKKAPAKKAAPSKARVKKAAPKAPAKKAAPSKARVKKAPARPR